MPKRKKVNRGAGAGYAGGGNNDGNKEGLLWVQEVQVRTSRERRPMANLTRWKKKLGVKTEDDHVVDAHDGTNDDHDDDDDNGNDNDNDNDNDGGQGDGVDGDQEQPLANEEGGETKMLNEKSEHTPIRSGNIPLPSSCAKVNELDDEDDEDDPRQFTVARKKYSRTFCERVFAGCNYFFNYDDVDEYSYRPSKLFVNYINWTFRRGFLVVFCSFLLIFFLICVAFGAFLKWAGDADPRCIVVSGEDYGYNMYTKYADAFALSWTTFTTVGYGMTYTSTGSDYENQHTHCAVVVFLCTAESFIGLLYAGMCTAILFGKVGRIQSHAQVKFSNALCIQIGLPLPVSSMSSTKSIVVDDSSSVESPQTPKREVTPQDDIPISAKARSLASGGAKAASLFGANNNTPAQSYKKQIVPFPVITFQVINKLCNEPGGEIMDANMRVVASDRGHSGSASVVASYMKVQLAEFEHPFFNRVWHGRHELNASSPLLTRFAKIMINQNGGLWPMEWNNPKDIRQALRFSEIIVTLTGISNVSAATVHAYKRYKYGDLLVGYEFAPVLYKSADTQRLKVDMRLIHDVVGQSDGRAEYFGGNGDDDDSGSFASIRLKEVGGGAD